MIRWGVCVGGGEGMASTSDLYLFVGGGGLQLFLSMGAYK